LRELLPFVVTDVLWIHRETGLLLYHLTSDFSVTSDLDLFSGMLTAIRDFSQDTLGGDEEGGLGEITYSDQHILIETGRHSYLAAIVNGVPPPGFKEAMREAIDAIENAQAELSRRCAVPGFCGGQPQAVDGDRPAAGFKFFPKTFPGRRVWGVMHPPCILWSVHSLGMAAWTPGGHTAGRHGPNDRDPADGHSASNWNQRPIAVADFFAYPHADDHPFADADQLAFRHSNRRASIWGNAWERVGVHPTFFRFASHRRDLNPGRARGASGKVWRLGSSAAIGARSICQRRLDSRTLVRNVELGSSEYHHADNDTLGVFLYHQGLCRIEDPYPQGAGHVTRKAIR
jgi:hypothetical protein